MTNSVNAEVLSPSQVLEHLAPYVLLLTGSVDHRLHWWVNPDNPEAEAALKGKRIWRTFRGPITDEKLLKRLCAYNALGLAIYVTVNEFPQVGITADNHRKEGSRQKEFVVRMRAGVVDFDCYKHLCPTGWTPGDVAGACGAWNARWPLPTMQVDSGGGPHLYWLYKAGEEPSVGTGEGINHALHRLMNSDPAVADAARVLRAPGFHHWKDPKNPKLVTLTFAEKDRRYGATELAAALAKAGQRPVEVPQHARIRSSAPEGEVEPVQRTPEETRRAAEYIREFIKRMPFTDRQRGHTLMTRVCPVLHDAGLSTQEAMPILRWWATHKVSQTPSADGEWPATDEMLMDKWLRSAVARENPRGCFILDARGGVVAAAEEIAARPAPSTALAVRQREPGDDDDVDDQPGYDQHDAPPPPPGGDDGDPPPPGGEDEDGGEAAPPPPAGVPVQIDLDHAVTIRAVEVVMAQHPNVYQHNSTLVYITHGTNGFRIEPYTKASVTKDMTHLCQFQVFSAKRGWVPGEPPPWVAAELIEHKAWPNVRPLKSLITIPRVRSDGSLALEGYDEESQTCFMPDDDMRDLRVGETREEAEAALELLLDVIADFPFPGIEQKAACVAAMLTPFARRSLNGPAPMFLVDGNKPNIGKTNLMGIFLSLVGRLAMSIPWAPADKYGNAEYQNSQRVNTAFLAGKEVLALDNLKGKFGDGVIDRLLTSSIWDDRKLGGTETIIAENHMTVYGTANQIKLTSDVWRRVIPIRLVDTSNGDRPPPRHILGQYLPTVRRSLVEACLTILRAFHLAGKPVRAKRMGSFESWSDTVASAVVWMGLPDVVDLVQTEVEADADSVTQIIRREVLDVVEAVCEEKGVDEVTSEQIAAYLEQVRTDAFSSASKKFPRLVGDLTEHLAPSVPISQAEVAATFREFRDNRDGSRVLRNVVPKSKRKGEKRGWRIEYMTASEDK